MTGPFANRLFRIAFALAGIYNLAFGLWAALRPLAFFEIFAIAPPRYPGIWACLGMVVGVYGLLYLYSASKLEAAWPIIAVGFLGKILGPIGMAMTFSDDWPARLGMMCIYNDLIWWLPFGLFLVRGTAVARWLEASAPWLCVIVHVAAVAIMAAFMQPGLLTESDPAARAAHVAANQATWSLGWATWMLAAFTIVGFYAWWGSRLNFPSPFWGGVGGGEFVCNVSTIAIVAVVITAFGVVFDFSAEGLFILRLTELARTADRAGFTQVEHTFNLLSPGIANALYTLGGALLTLATPNLPTWIRAAMWITWIAGFAMTLAALAGHVGGMVASTTVLFPLLIVWTAWMGAKWQPAADRS